MTNTLEPAREGRIPALRGGSLRAETVCKRYGAVKALDRVTIDVAAGEFLALLGPSGSGKTTLLMTMAGFESPDSGRVFVNGGDVTNVPPNRRNLGMVFQRYALFPHMSLRDNVGFPLRMRGIARDERDSRADKVLATVGLEGYGGRLPSQLSGGQQQRVALARAIVYEPPVLLMDEPLSALDKNLRERMRLEIKHLQKSLGITVIFVTHDQEEALVMADRIAVLDHGRLIQEGQPRELYHRPCDAFVAGFLGETNFLTGTICERQADRTVVRLPTGGLVAGEAGVADAGQVTLSVRPEAIDIAGTRPAGEALEGRVSEIIFAGASTILLVDVGLPEPINVRKPSGFGMGDLRDGARIWLHWRPQDARAFATPVHRE